MFHEHINEWSNTRVTSFAEAVNSAVAGLITIEHASIIEISSYINRQRTIQLNDDS